MQKDYQAIANRTMETIRQCLFQFFPDTMFDVRQSSPAIEQPVPARTIPYTEATVEYTDGPLREEVTAVTCLFERYAYPSSFYYPLPRWRGVSRITVVRKMSTELEGDLLPVLQEHFKPDWMGVYGDALQDYEIFGDAIAKAEMMLRGIDHSMLTRMNKEREDIILALAALEE